MPWSRSCPSPFSLFLPPPRGIVIVRGFGLWPRIVVGRASRHAWGHWDWPHHSVQVNINRRTNVNPDLSVNRAAIQTTRWRSMATVVAWQGLAKIGATKKQRGIISLAVLKGGPSFLVTGPLWIYSIIPSDSPEAGAISIGSVQYGCWPKYR